MYTFYEGFGYYSNTSSMMTKTWITNKVDVYVNPQPSLMSRVLSLHRGKAVSLNKNTNKLYVRLRARKATVRYANQEPYQQPEFLSKSSDNYLLRLHKTKEREMA